MPDALEQLKRFAEETIEELLKKLPAERLLKNLSHKERLEGLSTDELLAALSPEMRAALAERLKEYDSLPCPDLVLGPGRVEQKE
jgi:hypothetical protein